MKTVQSTRHAFRGRKGPTSPEFLLPAAVASAPVWSFLYEFGTREVLFESLNNSCL
jgi:hypothetical protein